jgi:beta-glucosidase
MEPKELKFPDKFYWGAATAAHQVEGGNLNDWSEWEKANAEKLAKEAPDKWQEWQKDQFQEMFSPNNYISGVACDHYNLFEKDFDIAKSLGHNAHRFSVEWSRIEPEEGKFNEKEIEHYRQVIRALKSRNIEPFVTLWHWTMPIWMRDLGGVKSKKFPEYFSRYAEKMAEVFKEDVKFWITLNEPTAIVAMSYIRGDWPPQEKNPISALFALKNLSRAHNLAYGAIRKVYSDAQVGFSHNMFYYEPYNKKCWLDKSVVKIAEYFANERFLNLTKGKNDFLGLQYYFHSRFRFPGLLRNENKSVSDLKWEIYPEGIYHILKGLKKYNLPIYITENGLADAGDRKRGEFIKNHLINVHRAIAEGADVRGYLYWSLLDNFEWDKGFWPRFGLVEVDYHTQERKIRPSALEYKKIIEGNAIKIQ